MSKARSISKLTPASSGVVSIAGTAALKVPVGTTAERPSGEVGLVRYNSTTGFTEVYNSGVGWTNIGVPPPTISNVTPVTYNGESGTSFTITGTNFIADAGIKFVTNDGTEYPAATVTFVNSTQITATTPQDFTVAQEPLDVKVVQSSGVSILTDCIDCGGTPTWTTTAGTLATINDAYGNYNPITTLIATDPDTNATISYSISSGSLPAGTSLNTNTGQITGDPTDVVAQTTSNFTIAAADNAGNISTRAFNIIVNPALDGTTSARAGISANSIKTLTGTTTDGSYWIKPVGCPNAFQVHCYMCIEGGGWVLGFRVSGNGWGPGTSGGFLTGNWAGWAYTTQTQIDALGYNYTTANGTNTFTPVFAYAPFNDVMIISGRSGQISKRLGWRHTNQISNVYSVTGGTSSQTRGNTILFGEPRNWLTSAMDVRPDTTTSSTNANAFYGFKINADSHGGTSDNGTNANMTGGFAAPYKGWLNSQIGYGRDNQDGSTSGGGFGCYSPHISPYFWAMGHHYWGHGASRASQFWSSDVSGPWYGHAMYIR